MVLLTWCKILKIQDFHIKKKSKSSFWRNNFLLLVASKISESTTILFQMYSDWLMKFIGRGAYGIVYKAKMAKTPHTERAVKIIPKVLIKNP